MLARNEQPIGYTLNFAVENNFNFAIDNLFVLGAEAGGGGIVVPNAFLLLNGSNFLLLDGTDFLLLGS